MNLKASELKYYLDAFIRDHGDCEIDVILLAQDGSFIDVDLDDEPIHDGYTENAKTCDLRLNFL